ncbi:site-specific integrase [Flagellimonas meridianipacifica]|uniref:Site-specific recombinase XerD n=1 Tax=Flagellimonas meridianipacifica TaxID=1080225 RepID=A0A2T0MIW7_9FLAO|nr:site-specific integrase [Allomuricauda pacifica]PRX57495.1 site-specific recombinase XerD [Allomuricauda pacifica]
MATYLKLSLDTRRKDTKIFPLIFRLTHNRKTTSIGTGHKLATSEWDEKRQKIRLSFKGTESPARLNNLLQKKMAHMVDILTQLEDKDRLKYMSISEVRSHITRTTNKVTFYQFAEQQIADLVKSNRIGNARAYKHALKAVKNFRNDKDFSFDELNLDFLNRFEKHHLAKGNKLGGLSVYLRTIRAINRKAIKAGVADKEGYAFDDYVIRNGKPEKRALPIDAIRKIAELDLEKDTALFRDRNIFMMSFLLNGMSYVDMAHLKLSNIVDGRIRYSRKKTDEPYNIKIHDQLKPLLSYFTEGKKRSDYLLDVVKSENPIESYNQIVWARKRYNDSLKKLAKLAGIDENITSYAARHSFASSANDMGIPLTAISQMLGHKRISTTQAYLAGLKKAKIDEYQDEIMGKLSG